VSEVELDPAVVIAGGGIAGTSLLNALARRGVEAMLIERSEEPSGASSLPAALLNPHRGRTGRARQLDLLGLAEFWRLADRLARQGLEPGTHREGVVRIASSARQAAGWRRLAANGSPLWLETDEVPAPYRGPHGGLLVPDGGWVEPERLLAALRAASRAAGARLLGGVELVGWRPAASGGLTVTAVSGKDRLPREFRARELVLCLGAYDAARCRLPRLELAPGVAVTLATEPSVVPAGTPPLAGAISVVPTGGGVVVSGGVLPSHGSGGAAGVRAEVLAEAVERLRAAAAWYLPGLAGAVVSATWHGIRARRPSGNPVVRRLAPGVTLFGALAGRGFLCGPLLAERLAAVLTARLVDHPSTRH